MRYQDDSYRSMSPGGSPEMEAAIHDLGYAGSFPFLGSSLVFVKSEPGLLRSCVQKNSYSGGI